MSRAARARLALGALSLVAILFVFVFPTRSYLAQRSQVNRQQHDLDVLRRQNDTLAAQAARLQTPDVQERMAREQFHLVFPGETPYVVVPGVSTPPATPAPGAGAATTTTAPPRGP